MQPFPGGPGLRKQISDSGWYPVWRRDGNEIVYHDGERIWSIPVTTSGDALLFGVPVALFAVGSAAGLVARLNPLAVTRDGSRIFFPRAAEQPDANMIHITAGWAED